MKPVISPSSTASAAAGSALMATLPRATSSLMTARVSLTSSSYRVVWFLNIGTLIVLIRGGSDEPVPRRR